MPHMSRKHWSDFASWTMAEYIHKEITRKTKQNMAAYGFFPKTYDEVTTIDNMQWISIHAYVVQDFAKVPMVLALEKVTEGGTASRLAICIIDAIEDKVGITRQDMRSNWISFGANGAAVFQGSRAGVTKILQERVTPHMEGVHCFSHRTNLRNPSTCFVSDAFCEFKEFSCGRHPSMSWNWTPSTLDLNSNEVEHIHWTCGPMKFNAIIGNEFGGAEPVTKDNFTKVITCVKSLCTEATKKLISELSSRFPASNIMDLLGVMYPQYWLQLNPDTLFERHFTVLKEQFYHKKSASEIVSPGLLSKDKLNHQCST